MNSPKFGFIHNTTCLVTVNDHGLKKLMPAEHDIDIQARLLITTWEGVAIDIDFIEAIKKYQQDIQGQKDYRDFNEVVDLTNVTVMKLTIDGLKKISSVASTTDQNRSSTKLAIIVLSNLVYGIAKIYQAYRSFSNNSKKELRVFKNKNDAFEWVKR